MTERTTNQTPLIQSLGGETATCAAHWTFCNFFISFTHSRSFLKLRKNKYIIFCPPFFFIQDVWAVLLLASRQGPEDCCVWLWLTEQRWESGWDHHRFGEQTPVSFQVLLWPATDLLCVSMPTLCTQWTHIQRRPRTSALMCSSLWSQTHKATFFFQFRHQSVERPAEAHSDPRACG